MRAGVQGVRTVKGAGTGPEQELSGQGTYLTRTPRLVQASQMVLLTRTLSFSGSISLSGLSIALWFVMSQFVHKEDFYRGL